MREALHAAWQQWTDEADLDGVTDFYGLQALAVRSLVETGETFAHLIPTAAGLRVRLLDGDMLPLSLSRLSASKHALLEAITEEVIARYQEMLQHALADSTTPTPALVRALFALMGAGIEEDRRFYRAVFRETAKIRLGLDEGGVGERAGREALALLVQLLARGQERGELSTAHRAENLASAFDSLVNGTITHWLYGDAAESLGRRMPMR